MKKALSITLAFALLVTVLALPVSAAIGDYGIIPFANNHVTSCTASLSTSGGRINIRMTVVGNGTQDKLGVSSVSVSEKVNGKWVLKESFTGDEDHDDFFGYNISRYTGSTYYDGVAGREYQIKIIGVGQKGGSSGSLTDTKTIVCK